jgi:hypothetical protein
MKKIVTSFVALALLMFYTSSCERDDLCADGTLTTPSLVIEFYYSSNRTQTQPVTNLQYFVEGMTDTLSPGTVSRIRVPLMTDAETTRWGFIFNEQLTGGTVPHLDYLDFRYIVNSDYISRACGYRATFLLDPDTTPNPNPLLTEGPDGSFWIDDIDVMTTEIVDEFETATGEENDVHIKIYF